MVSIDRIEDLVKFPHESLDVELKSWLDLRRPEDRANLAQALLALANHGGGFAVLGFTESGGMWTTAADAPDDVSSYTQDTVNSIVKKFADPSFHCEARLLPGKSDVAHLVISVPGGCRVPVRAKAGGPDNKHVTQGAYYIRRAGPESAPIQTEAEWDALLGRCLQARKDELGDIIRAAIHGAPVVSAPTAKATLAEWVASSEARLEALIKEKLSDERPDRYSRGIWTFSYALEDPVEMTLQDLMQTTDRACVRVTGWPVFLVMTKDAFAPYSYGQAIECWIREPGDQKDGAHSDFWRASSDGRLFLLRGYQEDGDIRGITPGTALDRGLPIWRIGECLLHVERFAKLVGRASGRAFVRAQWTGLQGRKVGDLVGDWPRGIDGRACRQEAVISEIAVDAASIRATLADLVENLTGPLYSAFDFSTVSHERIELELKKLLERGLA